MANAPGVAVAQYRRIGPAATESGHDRFAVADAALLAAQGTAHVLGCAKGLRYSQGFHDQTAEIWSAQGDLLAVGHQVVYFKE